MAQMGFFDLSDRYASLDAKKYPLVEIDAVLPWEEFRPTLEQVGRKPDAERKSRAACAPMDAVLMFKALVLSALYNLSDDQIEYQVSDRLSFMPFLGLGLGKRVPDAKTVWLGAHAIYHRADFPSAVAVIDVCMEMIPHPEAVMRPTHSRGSPLAWRGQWRYYGLFIYC